MKVAVKSGSISPVKIVMTLMVRDEVDIVGAMLQHHFSQGVDHVIATDNGSVDGTREVLAEYAQRGLVTLYDDPRHEKQQAAVVTRMAREAATDHLATWVLNADADEFWVAQNPELTLREALARIPTEYRAFPVPVIDMIGAPARTGSGLTRLVYRDERPTWRMNELGLHAHATPDVCHVGDPSVEVVQGNHYVSVESQGAPAPGQGIEVLHLQWRSWEQVSTKVRNAGEAYERSGLTPSPNHHGMRDFRRLVGGRLEPLYVARHPLPAEHEHSAPGALVLDRRLADTLVDPRPDEPYEIAEREAMSLLAKPLLKFEAEIEADAVRHEGRIISQEISREHVATLVGALTEELRYAQTHSNAEKEQLRNELEALRDTKVIRLAHRIGRFLPGRRTD